MEIYLKVGGVEYKDWGMLKISLATNTVASTFSFTGYRTKENEKLFAPGVITDATVWLKRGSDEPVLLMTGVIFNQGLVAQKAPSMETIHGISKCGILATVNYPEDLYPLQREGVTGTQICKEITNYYGLGLYIKGAAIDEANKIYEMVEPKTTETIYSFLVRIFKERGVTVAHDERGYLMLYKYTNESPAKSKIIDDDSMISMKLPTNQQVMHNTCMCVTDSGVENGDEGEGSESGSVDKATVKSPFLYDNRKLNKTVELKLEDPTYENLRRYAESELAKEARNLAISFEKDGWDFRGVETPRAIARAGFYINVTAPSLYLKGETKMVLETQTFTKTAKNPQMMQGTCVLPCVYTGVLPKQSPFKQVL